MAELLARYRRIARVVEHAIESLESAEFPIRGADPASPARHDIARIETPTGDLDALLAFQERLSDLEGVTKVTVTGSSAERSTFLVELAQESLEEVQQQIRCSVCDKVIREGSLPASHGLCDDCRADYGSSLR
ncbi:MAG: hypothetical protein AB7J35_09460 [Dehalococcoidia bacterium]